MTTSPFAIYRLYDDAGSLLYIGISRSPLLRASQHSDKQWYVNVETVSIERLTTTDRREAERFELQAIRAERPLHNHRGSVIGPKLSATKRMLSPGDIALMLRLSTRTVVRWGDEGWFGQVSLTDGGQRRYHREAVEAFMATREVVAV